MHVSMFDPIPPARCPEVSIGKTHGGAHVPLLRCMSRAWRHKRRLVVAGDGRQILSGHTRSLCGRIEEMREGLVKVRLFDVEPLVCSITVIKNRKMKKAET